MNKYVDLGKDEILYYIPARGGSKGIPKKNLMEVGGCSLVGRAVDSAKNCKYDGRIVVSTDSEEIAATALLSGAEVPCMRPAKLSQDDTSTYRTVKTDLRWLEVYEKYQPLILVLLQPTSPLRSPQDIEGAMQMFFEGDYDAVVSMCEPSSHPFLVRALDKNSKIVDLFVFGQKTRRRQEMPKFYVINGAIYIIKIDTLRQEKTFTPLNSGGFIMPKTRSIDVDSKLDLFMANQLPNFNCEG